VILIGFILLATLLVPQGVSPSYQHNAIPDKEAQQYVKNHAHVVNRKGIEFDSDAVSAKKATAIESNPYTPQQVASVYCGKADWTNTLSGKGQTIVIVTCYNYPFLQSDHDIFCKGRDVPKRKLNIINMGTRTDKGWSVETCLDTQWSAVGAPNANITVVCAASATFADLRKALLKAVELKPNFVSMSLGASESSYAINALEDIFQNNQDIIFLASSGDDPTVSYPSSSSNVISVGGTILHIKEDGQNTANTTVTKKDNTLYTKTGETDWFIPNGIGTGHGLSAHFVRPPHQTNTNTSYWRATPDVSIMSANPNGNGTSIYCTVNGGWGGVEGTSLGAPLLTGLLASANSSRIDAKKKPLTRVQILTALYSLHPQNAPIDTMMDGAGPINSRLIPYLVSLC
jgi:subtilase family serine protease